MKIVRCDRCEREVNASERRYNVVVQEAQSFNGSYVTMRSRDMCTDCYEAFLQFLERNEESNEANHN